MLKAITGHSGKRSSCNLRHGIALQRSKEVFRLYILVYLILIMRLGHNNFITLPKAVTEAVLMTFIIQSFKAKRKAPTQQCSIPGIA